MLNSMISKPKKKTDGVIGFAPSRIIENFSFRNPKHAFWVIVIIINIISITLLIHWLIDDFEAMELKQKSEMTLIEDLFTEEYEYMQENHKNTIKSLEEMTQSDIDNELKLCILSPF